MSGIMIFLTMLILSLMLLFNFFISKKKLMNYNKMLSFECGFDVFGFTRLPFSLQFYLIGILFLIFDVEITIILPMIKVMSMMIYLIYFNFLVILMILLIGLLIEWWEGALIWRV